MVKSLRLWKVLFWFNILVFIAAIFGMFTFPVLHWYMVLIDILLIIVTGIGLFSYVFAKPLFTLHFWKYFFWGNLIYALLSLIYQYAPANSTVKLYLSYLASIDLGNTSIGESIISYILSVPVYYALYQIGRGKFIHQKKKAKKAIKPLSSNMTFNKGVVLSSLVIVSEVALLLVYGAILQFISLPDVSGLIYLCFAIALLVLPFIFNSSKHAIKYGAISLGVSFVLLLGALSSLAFLPSSENAPSASSSVSLLSEKELFRAINNKRQEHDVHPLGYDKSTCVIAKLRVDEINEKGLTIFGNTASFQRIIDKAFEDKALIASTKPYLYSEAVTYQETVKDAIDYWNKNEAAEIFTNKSYTVGCVAETNGYAILILGEIDPESATPADADTFPAMLEGTDYNSI